VIKSSGNKAGGETTSPERGGGGLNGALCEKHVELPGGIPFDALQASRPDLGRAGNRPAFWRRARAEAPPGGGLDRPVHGPALLGKGSQGAGWESRRLSSLGGQ